MRRAERDKATQKNAPDRETTYLTFLPHMDEGFHTGYHSTPGVVSEQNKRPGEWLESLARYMHTNGQDVGYAIPDALAGEQQLRRLSRLSPEEALSHQPMIDYRAVLALLLLWDTWDKDESWPKLMLRGFNGENASLASSVMASLGPGRTPNGLWLFVLEKPGEVRPIALLSNRMAVTPAADPGDLSALLPPCVTWYDRVAKRFTDPCQSIGARDAAILLARLSLLIALNGQAEWKSPIYDPEASLCSLFTRYINDLRNMQSGWRSRLFSGDEDALNSLKARVLAVFAPSPCVTSERVSAAQFASRQNPLLNALLQQECPEITDDALTLYRANGLPFACDCNDTLLAPVRMPGETEALLELEAEAELLLRMNPEWTRGAASALRALTIDAAGRAGLYVQMPAWLADWANALEGMPAAAGRTLTLTYPLTECPAALCSLLHDMLGMQSRELAEGVFADALLLVAGNPFCDDALVSACHLDAFGGSLTAVPPLSPGLCQWLMEREEADGAFAPKLELADLRFTADEAAGTVTASMRIARRVTGEGVADSVSFTKTFTLQKELREGAAVMLRQSDLPSVTVWPNVRLTPGLWKQYFVHASEPERVDAWALDAHGWTQGALYQREARSWHTARVSRFPAFVALRRGGLSLGALYNDQPRTVLKRAADAAIAIDFGSISTTVMLRQDDHVQPAMLPHSMHRTLLSGGAPAVQAFLPPDALVRGSRSESTYYSVMDMFSDEPERWRAVLCDGQIYYHDTFDGLAAMSVSALYYNLKWSGDDYARRCLRLFLKQAMLQAALSARLWGSYAASWRVSVPNAMPTNRQEAYLELMRGLAREIAAETGLPLTSGVPSVLYLSENQADGLYFLGRSEVSATGGYLNLDIGGSTTDMSLWLNNASQAAVECSLELGCRQMLFHSLCDEHPTALADDFSDAPDALRTAALKLSQAFASEGTTPHGRMKCMLLLDDLFAGFAPEIRQAMADVRASGRVSYVECLLLMHIGFLFFLAGEMLERTRADAAMGALLPERMSLCIAGNGGQLLKLFTEEQLARLCTLAMTRLDEAHPLRMLLPVISRHPKQEVARGLLAGDKRLISTLQAVQRWNGTVDKPRGDLLRAYLGAFYRVFPQAAEQLMPHAFENGSAFTAAASMELDTIFANEKPRTPEDDAAMYVRCLAALKQMWRI